MDAVSWATNMWLYVVGVFFIVIALFQVVIKSKAK